MNRLKNLIVKNAEVFIGGGLIQSDTGDVVYYRWMDDGTLLCDGVKSSDYSRTLPMAFYPSKTLEHVVSEDSVIHIHSSSFITSNINLSIKGKGQIYMPKRCYNSINFTVAGLGMLDLNGGMVDKFAAAITGSSTVRKGCFTNHISVAVVGSLRIEDGCKSRKCNIIKTVVGEFEDCLYC